MNSINVICGALSLALVAFAMAPAACADELPTYQLAAKDGRFIPESIEVPAGQRFRIAIRNDGAAPEEFESIELRKETVLAPGVTRTLVFAPLKPGVYKFFGDFHPDTAKGQIVAKEGN